MTVLTLEDNEVFFEPLTSCVALTVVVEQEQGTSAIEDISITAGRKSNTLFPYFFPPLGNRSRDCVFVI